MNSRRSSIVVGATLALAVAFPTTGRADDKDKDKKTVLHDAVVHFAQPQPQTPDPAPVGAAVTHFLLPDDVTIRKGGTVTFVVNGGGHGIAIHPVSKKTTRDDGTRTTTVTINGTPVVVTGTQNLDYNITDAKDDLIIHTGFNIAAPNVVVITNPRVDDTEHTHRLLATSGGVTTSAAGVPSGDASAPGANPAGAFLTGSAAPATPGNRIQVQFLKNGRYLVVCMNRGHFLNDHMFGFVSVVGGGDDDDDDK